VSLSFILYKNKKVEQYNKIKNS